LASSATAGSDHAAGANAQGTPARSVAAAERVRTRRIVYRAHNGARRAAWVVLPAWYRPGRNPRIPLVISPHGRGISGRANARLFGRLPALGRFAVVSPEGQGRRLTRYSWGFAGQIADLARMPTIVRRALPWVRVDRRQVYAFGGSMGGLETLLLVARHPRLLAGAAAFDSTANLALQYRRIGVMGCSARCTRRWGGIPVGRGIQGLMRTEIGGRPAEWPRAYARRSPLHHASAIARSCVPLQLWWSIADKVIRGQDNGQSGKLFSRITRLNPDAPVSGFVGYWTHSSEMRASSALPLAFAGFGLLDADVTSPIPVRILPAPQTGDLCRRGDGRSAP
jgi:dipeptidyl aminopeptidase/acylaminoacyl peptidase